MDPGYYLIHTQADGELVMWQSVTLSQSPLYLTLRVLGSRKADQHSLQVRKFSRNWNTVLPNIFEVQNFHGFCG